MRRAMSKRQVPARTRFSGMMAGVTFAILVIVAVIWYFRGSQGSIAPAVGASPATASGTSASSAPAAFAGRFYPPQGHAHLDPSEPDDFVYNSNPPTSGPHKEIFSDQFVNPNPLPVYVQVHLLEHGNILLQYACQCPDIAASLSSIAYGYDAPLIAPNELQPSVPE